MNLYNEVLAFEYGNAIVFGQVHQLTVDTYAVQHAGGIHRDKSVIIHLAGLYLMHEEAIRPPNVPPYLQQMSKSMAGKYPHFDPPPDLGNITVLDVAQSVGDVTTYISTVKRWAASVWQGWAPRHHDIAALAQLHMKLH